jgi:hypothetical protein
MRGWWQLGWVSVVLCYGCSKSASEPSLQAAVASHETQPAQCSPSRRAAIQDRAGFVEALRTLQGCEWSALTPRAIANAVGANLHASESGKSWEFDTNSELLAVSADAPGQDAPASWIRFHPRLNLGVTMALIEALYGSSYGALPPGKDTTVIFEPADGSYVAIKLFGSFKTPKPAALVNYLQLRPPEVQKHSGRPP